MVNINKKVIIVTLHGYKNYGNKLQNYALSTYVRELCCCVETLHFSIIDNPNQKKKDLSRIKYLFNPKVFLKFFLNKIKKHYIKSSKLTKKRIMKFKEFSVKHLNESIKELKIEDLYELNKQFDFFITGSDQVWNPSYVNDVNYYKYFLTFVEKEKSIAYAASFGVATIDEKYNENYKKWLGEFNYISVREDAGQKIVSELLGYDVPVLVDPTLLLTKEQWLEIANKHENKPKKYVLTYFLSKQRRKFCKWLESFAKENDCELVNLNNFKDKERYAIDPSEFLDYFNNAEIVFTDSFHGTVFSILFEKPFVVFNRGNMNSRIETLLTKFKFESRHWDYVKDNSNFFDIDFTHVSNILKVEREKSYNYLIKALGVES